MPGGRFVLLLAGLACAGAAVSAEQGRAQGPVSQSAQRARVSEAAVGEAVMRQVNALREQQGSPPVSRNAQLDAAAQEFASFMARTARFSHEADGRVPPQRAEQHGYRHCVVTENIGYEQRSPDYSGDELARTLFEGWKNSPPHRHNIVDGDVTDLGFGLAQSSTTGKWYAVQMFGLPKAAGATFEVENQAAATVHYRVDERRFELPPRATRTHQECRRAQLALEGSDARGPSKLQARSGGHYVVTREASGSLRLEPK